MTILSRYSSFFKLALSQLSSKIPLKPFKTFSQSYKPIQQLFKKNLSFINMLSEETTIFPKQLKIDDYQSSQPDNLLRIMQTSNLLLGTGARVSHTAIIMAKCLHFMQDEASIKLKGQTIVQLGCGVGLLGIYLGCIGSDVLMTDLAVMRDMVEKNININREKLKGEVKFGVLNWKEEKKEQMEEEGEGEGEGEGKEMNELQTNIDYCIVCEGGNLDDLECQMKWMGKKGMIVGFMERSYDMDDEYLNAKSLERYLLKKQLEYEQMEGKHPDYEDERVKIYRIWK